MVAQSRWTGYFTEIANLVPACGKCNQSRGSKDVATWMRSKAPWSPKLIFQSRDGMNEVQANAEVERRIAILKRAIAIDPPTRLAVLDDPLEHELEECREELNTLLHRAEAIAASLRALYRSSVLDVLPR